MCVENENCCYPFLPHKKKKFKKIQENTYEESLKDCPS